MAHIPPTSKFRGRKNAFKKEKIYNFLKDNVQLSTREIQDLMNNNTKWGITMTELGNILARTPEFEKIGIRLITQDNKVVIPKTLSECIQQVEMGSSFQNKYYLGLKHPPLISLIYLIIIIIYPLKPFRRRQ